MQKDGACNYRFGGPAMKHHRERAKWNVKHILDFKNLNPHIKEEKKAYQDLLPGLINVPVGYAMLCPNRAGKVQAAILSVCTLSILTNVVLGLWIALS